MTDTPNKAIAALCKAQAEMTGAIKGETNPHFRRKYADLGAVQDACLPALHKHGFAVTHRIWQDEAGGYLETVLWHESGGDFSCHVPLRVDKDNMQGLGSAITYARRYGLMCVSGVAPEDDDGNKATEDDDGNKATDNPPKPKLRQPDPLASGDANVSAAREIAKIKTITDADELGSYWRALYEAQPLIQKRPDVIAAKDERKLLISEEAA